MIHTPSDNIIMNTSEKEREEKVRERLAIIQKDVAKASAELPVLEAECIQKEKYNVFLEEEIAKREVTLSGLETEISSIEKSIIDGKKTLESYKKDTETMLAELSAREEQIKVRESELVSKEADIAKRDEESLGEATRLSVLGEKIEKAAQALTDAKKLITWK